jgi:hypothetical protein
MPVAFKVVKRAVPTVTITNENLSNFGSMSASVDTVTGWRASATATGNNNAAYYRCRWAADAEL